eukprot:g8074.t1
MYRELLRTARAFDSNPALQSLVVAAPRALRGEGRSAAVAAAAFRLRTVLGSQFTWGADRRRPPVPSVEQHVRAAFDGTLPDVGSVDVGYALLRKLGAAAAFAARHLHCPTTGLHPADADASTKSAGGDEIERAGESPNEHTTPLPRARIAALRAASAERPLLLQPRPPSAEPPGTSVTIDGRPVHFLHSWQKCGASGASGSGAGAGIGLTAGAVLLAHPLLTQAVLERAVVLVAQHEPERGGGSMGFVLNNPLQCSAAAFARGEAIAGVNRHEWAKELLGDSRLAPLARQRIWLGGDCEAQSRVQLLHTAGGRIGGSMPVAPGLWLGGDWLGAAELLRDGRLAPRDVRLCAGYCGWGAGQLEGEVSRGVWAVARAGGGVGGGAGGGADLGATALRMLGEELGDAADGDVDGAVPEGDAWRGLKSAVWAAQLANMDCGGDGTAADALRALAYSFPVADESYRAAVESGRLIPVGDDCL